MEHWEQPSRARPGRGRTTGVLAAAALVGVLLGTAVAYLAGAFDREPRTPEQAVRDYYQALREVDCDRILDLFTEASWSPNGSVPRPAAKDHCERTFGVFPPDYLVAQTRLVSLEEDRAVVDVVRHPNPARREALDEQTRRDLDEMSERLDNLLGEPDDARRFNLRREDGQWRIHVPEGIGPADEHGGWPVASVWSPAREERT